MNSSINNHPVSILMVGIGGYGYYYLKTLLEEFPPGTIEIRGIVDPLAEQSGLYTEIKRMNVPVYPEITEFYENGNTADLAVIVSPIHYHVPQSLVALKYGSHVLCEKPVAATVQEVDSLIDAVRTTGKWCMIGYQWSYSKAIQSLKKDIIAGRFGRPIRLKALHLWQRDEAYYRRNDWAGRIRDSNGRWILDSPANNAIAHLLHNLFYVTGGETGQSDGIADVTAEAYRVNSIENYDTVACRIHNGEGVELLFYTSHTIDTDAGPGFSFEFENAIVSLDETSTEITATFKNGNMINYGSPEDDDQFLKLHRAVEAVRKPQPVVCGPEAARSQVLCIDGIQESVPEIPSFPKSMIRRDATQRIRWVTGLDEAFLQCYKKGILPTEAKFTWAKSGRTVDLTGYRHYPGSSS